MAFLAGRGYKPIFAIDLVNALRLHTSLPAKSIVITIDDGYDDIYTYAFPVIKKYNIKVTLVVPTGLLGVSSSANSYYSWGQLKEMMGSGLADVVNHTFSHYPMGTKGATKDEFEVITASKELEDNLGKSVTLFAYPYGTNSLSLSIHALLQRLGFIGAFSTIGGTYQCDSFLFNLHRTRVGSIPFPSFGIY